jgi:geranylgeranyl pyrophosphate synthase
VTEPLELEPQQLHAWLAPRLSRVDATLRQALVGCWPERLGEAMRYALFSGGKRVRPGLVLAAFDAVRPDADPEPALPAAAAVELVHSYSLVHDDLPAMDDDDERRGRPTVHKAFGEGAAILVGDALLTEAFVVLAGADVPAASRVAMVRRLGEAAGARGMVAGQGADIGLGGPVTGIDALTRLHAGKTGALLAASAALGGLAAGATAEQQEALERFGRSVGLAFQLADDVLDAAEAEDEQGPPSFVRLLGVDETRRRAEALAAEGLAAIGGLPRREVLAALARFVVEREV